MGRARSSRWGLAGLGKEQSDLIYTLKRDWVIGRWKWEPGDQLGGCRYSPDRRWWWLGLGQGSEA